MFKNVDGNAKEGYADFSEFKAGMFSFFNSPLDPLLNINEIERVIYECQRYIAERNKRRDIISKKTVRKVVYKGICSNVFINALLRGHTTPDESACEKIKEVL